MEQRAQDRRRKLSRIQDYHEKLKEKALNEWALKQATRAFSVPSISITNNLLSEALAFFPKSREQLYIQLDFRLERQSDMRFYMDAQSHLKAYPYIGEGKFLPIDAEKKSLLDTMHELKQKTVNYNQRVMEFTAWEDNIPATIANSIVLLEDKLEVNSIPPEESFNTNNLREYLSESHESSTSSQLTIEQSEGVHILSHQRGTGNRVIAKSRDPAKINVLMQTLKQGATEYSDKITKILSEMDAINGYLSKFKENVQEIIHDIDEGVLKGRCNYEETIMKTS